MIVNQPGHYNQINKQSSSIQLPNLVQPVAHSQYQYKYNKKTNHQQNHHEADDFTEQFPLESKLSTIDPLKHRRNPNLLQTQQEFSNSKELFNTSKNNYYESQKLKDKKYLPVQYFKIQQQRGGIVSQSQHIQQKSFKQYKVIKQSAQPVPTNKKQSILEALDDSPSYKKHFASLQQNESQQNYSSVQSGSPSKKLQIQDHKSAESLILDIYEQNKPKKQRQHALIEKQSPVQHEGEQKYQHLSSMESNQSSQANYHSPQQKQNHNMAYLQSSPEIVNSFLHLPSARLSHVPEQVESLKENIQSIIQQSRLQTIRLHSVMQEHSIPGQSQVNRTNNSITNPSQMSAIVNQIHDPHNPIDLHQNTRKSSTISTIVLTKQNQQANKLLTVPYDGNLPISGNQSELYCSPAHNIALSKKTSVMTSQKQKHSIHVMPSSSGRKNEQIQHLQGSSSRSREQLVEIMRPALFVKNSRNNLSPKSNRQMLYQSAGHSRHSVISKNDNKDISHHLESNRSLELTHKNKEVEDIVKGKISIMGTGNQASAVKIQHQQ